jgi:cell division protease FtsH
MNLNLRKFLLSLVILIIPMALIVGFAEYTFHKPSQPQAWQEISFSELLTNVNASRVREITIRGSEIRGTYFDGRNFGTDVPSDPTLTQRLYKLAQDKGVTIKPPPPSSM